MENEEKEAMWERIKALEKNNLYFAKELCQQSINTSILLGYIVGQISGKPEGATDYIKSKIYDFIKQVDKCEDIEELRKLNVTFRIDCFKFAGAYI